MQIGIVIEIVSSIKCFLNDEELYNTNVCYTLYNLLITFLKMNKFHHFDD